MAMSYCSGVLSGGLGGMPAALDVIEAALCGGQAVGKRKLCVWIADATMRQTVWSPMNSQSTSSRAQCALT
jgi:hypothetical protein